MNLAVITCHFNPAGYQTPKRNLHRFLRQMQGDGIPVYVAELAYDPPNWILPAAKHIVRIACDSSQVMWHKENLLNILERHVPAEYDALAWIDADVWFENRNWYADTVRMLQRCAVGQLFDEVMLTDIAGRKSRSMPAAAAVGHLNPGKTTVGFAWAARRNLWSEAGGLFERAVIGGGDAINANAWLSTLVEPHAWLNYHGLTDNLERLRQWSLQGGGIGSVAGKIWHEWHGESRDRRYEDRSNLVKNLSLKNDLQSRADGLLEFAPHVSMEMREQIRSYFFTRDEDRE